jgi:hypothetical protein
MAWWWKQSLALFFKTSLVLSAGTYLNVTDVEKCGSDLIE